MRHVLDTNVFNRLADGVIGIEDLPKDEGLVATPVQEVEIEQTQDEARRKLLLSAFHHASIDLVPSESAVFGYARWGEVKWSDGSNYRAILAALDKRKKGSTTLRANMTCDTYLQAYRVQR